MRIKNLFQQLTYASVGLALFFQASGAHAYYTTMETGKLLEDGHYRLMAESQFVTQGDTGVNLGARVDGPINDELNWKAQLGFGVTDIFLAGYIKWVPFPDAESQPAIGLTGGVLYARNAGLNEQSLRFHPFVSKLFKVDLGDINPYASLPIGIRSVDGHTTIPVQLALGTEFRPKTLDNISFLAEVGFDVTKAFSYFTIGAALDFDSEKGFEFH